MKHPGNKCISVQCVSPEGVRKIVFRYHYDDHDDRSRVRAGVKAHARQAEYQGQGWRTRTRLESVP